MTYFLMYLLTIVDNVNSLAWFIGVFGSIIFLAIKLILGICLADNSITDKEFVRYWKKPLRLMRNVCIPCLILATLLPSQKGLAFVFIAPQIIDNGAVKETVKNIPELTQLGTEYLKEILKEKTKEIAK